MAVIGGLPPVWSFWCDRYTGPGTFAPVGPVECGSFTATSTLSDFGSGSAGIRAATCSLTDTDLLNLWGWRLWAFRNGLPVWCGMPTGLSDSGDSIASVTLTELAGYLTKRAMDVRSLTFGQAEQTQIAATLASTVDQVGMTIRTDPGPGFVRDRTYQFLEDTMGQLLINLSQVISGPQFRTELTTSPTEISPGAVLHIGYPRVGTDTGLGIVVPGSTVSYSATWDADMLRTRTIALGDVPDGAPDGTPRPYQVENRPQATRPWLDVVDQWSGTILTSTLAERADTNATLYAEPVLALTATADGGDPPLGTYNVGDTVTVTITSPLLSGGLDVTGQLTALNIDASA
ncbi:MAG: hypothetical protein J2P28_20390, partial [Actinobacteria bacterium]|nr:hypothetical protein [Actinomycetota bacterium]